MNRVVAGGKTFVRCRMRTWFAITLSLTLFVPAAAGDEVAWLKMDQALKKASAENKFIVLDISATW